MKTIAPWKVFPDLNRDVVEATHDLVKMKPWSLPRSEQQRAAFMWLSVASHAYGLVTPRLEFDGRMRGNLGEYRAGVNVIRMQKFSLVTLLHEFRHAMQAQLPRLALRGTIEDDALAWSCSMFYKAAPRRFRRMLKAGRIQIGDK